MKARQFVVKLFDFARATSPCHQTVETIIFYSKRRSFEAVLNLRATVLAKRLAGPRSQLVPYRNRHPCFVGDPWRISWRFDDSEKQGLTRASGGAVRLIFQAPVPERPRVEEWDGEDIGRDE